jgi:hypothetical protein
MLQMSLRRFASPADVEARVDLVLLARSRAVPRAAGG